jgi:hypothetical protein
MADHEEVMARARAYVVERRAAAEMRRRTVAELTRRYGLLVSGGHVEREREHVTIPRGASLHEGNTRSGSIVVVDDEWSRLVWEFVASPLRRQQTTDLLAGLVGSGKASAAWWGGVPEKSGIELRDEVPMRMSMRLGGTEIARFRGGFVSDDELRDVADMPIAWTPPATPRRPRWWLIVRHPWPSLRGWWDGRQARRW